jgi:hypothetical protein
MSASPDSLRRTRLGGENPTAQLRPACLATSAAKSSFFFSRPGAQLEADEAADLAVLSPILETSSVCRSLMDFLSSLTHACSRRQDLLLPLGDLAVDDLAQHGLRLARLPRLREPDLPLLLDELGGDVLRLEVERAHGRDLQRDLPDGTR